MAANAASSPYIGVFQFFAPGDVRSELSGAGERPYPERTVAAALAIPQTWRMPKAERRGRPAHGRTAEQEKSPRQVASDVLGQKHRCSTRDRKSWDRSFLGAVGGAATGFGQSSGRRSPEGPLCVSDVAGWSRAGGRRAPGRQDRVGVWSPARFASPEQLHEAVIHRTSHHRDRQHDYKP